MGLTVLGFKSGSLALTVKITVSEAVVPCPKPFEYGVLRKTGDCSFRSIVIMANVVTQFCGSLKSQAWTAICG